MKGSRKMNMITNCYSATAKRPKLQEEVAIIHWPEQEWTYSHHPHIVFFKNEYYAFWSNGKVNEDDVGQRILMSTSVNFTDWSEPVPLVDSLMGKNSELVLSMNGVYTDGDMLSVYIGSFEYRPEALRNGVRIPEDSGHMDTTLLVTTTTDGNNWTSLRDMKIPIAANFGPQPTSTGRLIISGGTMFPYTDDPTGQTGWTLTGIYPRDEVGSIVDDSASIWKYKEQMGWPGPLCEGSFYETDDHTIHMLLRTNTDKLWLTESVDDGATWSVPRPTEFTDNATKFHFGRLPDGRFYYVGCPDPEPRWQRNPLVLSISEDGYRFDRHFILGNEFYTMKQAGLYKNGSYGYPHTMLHDGYLYVIYSIFKEGIAVLRVPIETI